MNKESKPYKFMVDVKKSAWIRYNFEVPANSKKEALDKIRELRERTLLTDDDIKEAFPEGTTEFVQESEVFMFPPENDGLATLEVMDRKTGEVFITNEIDV